MHAQEQVSTTDPDPTYATKGGAPARLTYNENYLVDNQSCVIVGVQATAARLSQETVAAQDMITRFSQWQRQKPASVAADATYGTGEFFCSGCWIVASLRICAHGAHGGRKARSMVWYGPFHLSAGKQQLSLPGG